MITIIDCYCLVSGDELRMQDALALSRENEGIEIARHSDADLDGSTKQLVLRATAAYAVHPLVEGDPLVAQVYRVQAALRQLGASDFVLCYFVGYPDQCNMEFHPSDLKKLIEIGVDLRINVRAIEVLG